MRHRDHEARPTIGRSGLLPSLLLVACASATSLGAQAPVATDAGSSTAQQAESRPKTGTGQRGILPATRTTVLGVGAGVVILAALGLARIRARERSP